MSGAAKEIEKIVGKAEKAAYQRGWDACIAWFVTAANQAKSPVAEAPSPKPGGLKRRQPSTKTKAVSRVPKGSAEELVLGVITEHPGTRGTTIAKVLAGKVNKHTVRTVLRRAKLNKKIEQDHIDGWHLKGNARREAA